MNLSYYRRSAFSVDDTVTRLKAKAQEDGFILLGETTLPGSGARMVQVCKTRWADAIMKSVPSLVGLIPCSVVVYHKADKVMVGAGSPSLLGGVSDALEVQELATAAEAGIRKLVDDAAGADRLRPAGVRLYSTRTCPYCRMEKSWLESRKVAFDLVFVDDDQAEAERLVARTGQMGVPVTEILYEDMESEFVLGFDKARLEGLLVAAAT